MKLDTPKAVVVGLLLVALAVFMSGPRYALVQPSAIGAGDYLLAVRIDTRTGKADACFGWHDLRADGGSTYRIACDGKRRD